jgi:hypothetical protein|tara:strand:+ start:656 stop:943 length:288 start_codon:yes stop_codon:yes gene_type:complete
MTKNDAKNKLVKQLIKQISGKLTEKDELIPEVAISGVGDIWCYDPLMKMHKKVYRGVKAYILYENYDHYNRTLIYTINGDMICIDPEELLHTGYD